ncbi:hypothetical protein QUF75_07010 [Desulfococcaceae bacterium HSG7]|nr:hypothetical protein [Desulfococcaceae bacterium HSG7]
MPNLATTVWVAKVRITMNTAYKKEIKEMIIPALTVNLSGLYEKASIISTDMLISFLIELV